MHPSIVIAAFGSTLSSSELCSIASRSIRTANPALSSEALFQLPLVDGGSETVEVMTTVTLGSFIEVEAHDASGAEVIVPIGFLGPDNTTAIIETAAILGRGRGSSYGLGELIAAAVSEGARSVIIGYDPSAISDFGVGMAAALGFQFFDQNGALLNMTDRSDEQLLQIRRAAPGSRSFDLIYLKTIGARSAANRSVSDESIPDPLMRGLGEIIERDLGVRFFGDDASADQGGIENGLQAFLNADIQSGTDAVFSALGLDAALRGSSSVFLVLDKWDSDGEALQTPVRQFLECAKQSGCSTSIILLESVPPAHVVASEAIAATLGAALIPAADRYAYLNEGAANPSQLLRTARLLIADAIEMIAADEPQRVGLTSGALTQKAE